MQRQALLALLTKSDVPAATDYAKTGMLAPPQMQQYKKAGKGESFKSGAGLIGGLLGGLAPLMKKKTTQGGSGTIDLGIGAF